MAKAVVAVHIGSRVVHGLALSGGRREWAVAGGQTVGLADGEEVEIAGPIRQLARSLKLRGRQPATLVLGKQQGIIRSVMLPSTDEAELTQMARFEAERHIPFNAERHSVGFHVMRSKGVEGSEVLLAAVDGPVVMKGLSALEGTGLVPDGITISSTCLVNSLLFTRGEAGEGRTVAVLSIGLDSLGLVFLTQGRVIYAREVGTELRTVLENWIGHRHDSGAPGPDSAKLAVAAHMIDCERLDVKPATPDAEEKASGSTAQVRRWLGRVGQDIQRTYDFARREMKCPPLEALVITGEGAALRNLDEYMARETGLPVEVLNPVGKLPGAERHKFAFHGLEYTVAFGALVGRHQPKAYDIDLTPAAHYKALSKKSLVRRLAVTGGLLAATLGLGFFTLTRYQADRQRTIEEYAAINEKLAPIYTDLNQMRIKTGIIKTFVHDPNAALNVFDHVTGAPMIPGSVFLQRVDYSKGETLMLDGMAKSVQDITSFIAYLDQTGHFADVNITSQDPADLWHNPVYRFKLECPINTGTDERGRSR